MPVLDAQVKSEGIRILRLCQNLNEFILSGQARKTYLYQTESFLEYIKTSLKAIEKFIRKTIEDEIDPPLAKVKLKDFDLIRLGVSWLYTFVKEAVDADTLSIPYSLTIFLNHAAEKLQKDNEVSLVVLGSPDLMYYNYNLASFFVTQEKSQLTCSPTLLYSAYRLHERYLRR